jgi:hypothetical protein
LAALCVSGCVTYRERPIDLAASDAAWRARHQHGETVSAFARSLEERGGVVPVRIVLDDGIDLAEAEVLVLLWNHDLRRARAQAGITGSEAAHAGRLDDPEIGIDALRALESLVKPWSIASSLSLTLPLSGRLGLEHQHAHRLAAADRLTLLTQEWSMLALMRDAWITWSAISIERLQAQAFAEDTARLAVTAERLRVAGELSVVAARAVHIVSLKATLAAQELTVEAERQRLGLLALMGFAPEAPLTLHPTLRLTEDLMQRLGDEQVADDGRLRSALAAHQVAEAKLRLEVRRQYPDLRLGLGYEDDRGDRSLGPVVGFTLPLWNSNAQAIAGAQARREETAAEVDAAYAAAIHDRAQAKLVVVDRRARLAEVERTLIPLVDAQVGDAQRLAELGDLDVPLLLDVFDAVWSTKRDLVRLRADLAQAHNRLIALSLPAWMTRESGTTTEGAVGAGEVKR